MLDDVLVLATKSRAEGAPAILVYDLAGVGASSGSAAAPMRQLPLKLTWMRPEAKVISAVHVRASGEKQELSRIGALICRVTHNQRVPGWALTVARPPYPTPPHATPGVQPGRQHPCRRVRVQVQDVPDQHDRPVRPLVVQGRQRRGVVGGA